MEKKHESLAEYVRRVREEKKFSLSDVERRSGHLITNGYVSRIENGYILNVTPKKLVALAKGLGVSEDELFAVARGKSSSDDLQLPELRLLEYFRTLSEEKQDDLLAIIEAMIQRGRAATSEPVDESLPHGGRKTTRVRAGKYVSQHHQKELRKKQG